MLQIKWQLSNVPVDAYVVYVSNSILSWGAMPEPAAVTDEVTSCLELPLDTTQTWYVVVASELSGVLHPSTQYRYSRFDCVPVEQS